jgi:hypothetical protein
VPTGHGGNPFDITDEEYENILARRAEDQAERDEYDRREITETAREQRVYDSDLDSDNEGRERAESVNSDEALGTTFGGPAKNVKGGIKLAPPVARR